MTQVCHREHKVGDIHFVRRVISPLEEKMNRAGKKELDRAIRKTLEHQMRDEAQRCGLVISPIRYRETRVGDARAIEAWCQVKELVRR